MRGVVLVDDAVDRTVGVEALGEHHDRARLAGQVEDHLLRCGELRAPGAGAVLRGVDAVVHGRDPLEVGCQGRPVGDVDATALDQVVLGTAAGPGQQSDGDPPLGELQGHGGADGAGSGDDVGLVRGGHGWTPGFRERCSRFRPACVT